MVYFLLNTRNRLIKIGKAIDPIKRTNDLQRMHTDILELLGWIVGGETTEGHYHKMFRNERVYDEWFRISVERAMKIIGHQGGRQFYFDRQMRFPFEGLSDDDRRVA